MLQSQEYTGRSRECSSGNEDNDGAVVESTVFYFFFVAHDQFFELRTISQFVPFSHGPHEVPSAKCRAIGIERVQCVVNQSFNFGDDLYHLNFR